jgi:hypothetical protein
MRSRKETREVEREKFIYIFTLYNIKKIAYIPEKEKG